MSYIETKILFTKTVFPNRLGYYFTDKQDPGCVDCGLIILYATGSTLGHWEMSGSSDAGFSPLPTDNSTLEILRPCLEKQSVTFRGTVTPENCAGNCTGSDVIAGSVCPPDGYVRFVRDDGASGWTAIDALSIKLVFVAFEGSESDVGGGDGVGLLDAPNCVDKVCCTFLNVQLITL
jgi:hypothetical protein